MDVETHKELNELIDLWLANAKICDVCRQMNTDSSTIIRLPIELRDEWCRIQEDAKDLRNKIYNHCMKKYKDLIEKIEPEE